MEKTYTLQADGITYRAGGRDLLSRVSARFRPGHVTAVLGPSGSGKSTLLKCLNTMYRPAEGKILLNSENIADDVRRLRQVLGYVPQDDVIHRELTVRDAFYYSARLRLHAGYTDEVINERINRIAGKLGMSDRMHHRIRRLSGGQRKRVNIGVELLADPALLILDEPASGLDPATEEDLLLYLRGLAQEDRTVILTTHSMEYLDRVDRIIVLVAGHIAFAGSLAGLLGHFGIPHVAEVFRTLRDGSPEGWARKWRETGMSD